MVTYLDDPTGVWVMDNALLEFLEETKKRRAGTPECDLGDTLNIEYENDCEQDYVEDSEDCSSIETESTHRG